MYDHIRIVRLFVSLVGNGSVERVRVVSSALVHDIKVESEECDVDVDNLLGAASSASAFGAEEIPPDTAGHIDEEENHDDGGQLYSEIVQFFG